MPKPCLATVSKIIPKIPNGASEITNLTQEEIASEISFITSFVLSLDFFKAIPIIIEKLVPMIPKIVVTIVETLIENLPVLLEGAVNLFMALVEAIPVIVVELVKALPQIITAVVNGLAEPLKKLFGNLWENIKKVFTNMKDGIGNIFNAIKESVMAKVNFLKNGVVNIVTGIKDGIVSKFNFAKDTLLGIFDKIKNGITDKIQWAKDKISGIIDKIKGLFNFQFKLPKIKTPHFGISPKGWKLGDLLEGSIPRLNIEWRKDGAIFTRPTLFNSNRGMQGVGEAGAEAVLPISLLESYINNAFYNSAYQSQMYNAEQTNRIVEALERLDNMEIYMDSYKVGQATATANDNINGQRVNLRGRGVSLA